MLASVCAALAKAPSTYAFANRPFVAMVVGRGVVQRFGFGGIGDAHHGAQYLVIDLNEFGGIFGLL